MSNSIQSFQVNTAGNGFTWQYQTSTNAKVGFDIINDSTFTLYGSKNNIDPSVGTYAFESFDNGIVNQGTYAINMYLQSDAKKTTITTAIVQVTTPCLLDGTLVQTPKSQQRIETLKIGDYVLNQYKQPVKITKIHKQRCKYDPQDISKTIYKIPKGLFGATSDVYLTHHHKFLANNTMIKAGEFNLEKPRPEEFSTNNMYTVYHLRLEDELNNHFVVNGGCVVEDWWEWVPKTKQ